MSHHRWYHIILCLTLLGLLGACSSGHTGEVPITEIKRRALDPGASSYLGQAQQAYGRGQFSQALALVDSAGSTAPDLADVAFLRGIIQSKLYQFEEAARAFSDVLILDPMYRGASYNQGNNAFLQGGYRESLVFYRQELSTMEETPKSMRAFFAEADSQALPVILLQVGRAYAKLGVIDSARTSYQESLLADSTNAQAYSWLKELSETEGNLDVALTYAQRALELDSENLEYAYHVGALLYRTGRSEEALSHLEKVVIFRPMHEGAHYNLGRVLLTLGRVEEGNRYLARTDTLQAIHAELAMAKLRVSQVPSDADRWMVYAQYLQRVGQRKEAQEAFHIARALQ